jgi:GNAT superfamily N-acetyltransferase
MSRCICWQPRLPERSSASCITSTIAWTIGDYCYLQDLFVAADARGKGVGAELIKHVEKIARAAGASRIYWLTKEDNVSARALYDKLADRSGFIQYRKLF